MAAVYANLIRNGATNPKTGKPYTLMDVPAVIREQVAELLKEGNGDEAAE